MGYYMGMDHGTTKISFELIDENKREVAYFELDRDKLSNNEVSFKDTLKKKVNIKDIQLLAMTYSMGDAINKITPIDKLENRGIKSINGAGKVMGGGNKVYDEVLELEIPAVLIPGLHKDSTFMDPHFTRSYSHCASSEKVSLTYYAYKMTGHKNMIISDISSNTVSILVENGRIRGALDACIGAMGFIHGPIDLEMIRKIDEGKITANEAFSNAGIKKIAQVNSKVTKVKDEIINNAVAGDKSAIWAIESLAMTTIMEIYSLYGITNEKIESIILTGSGGTMTQPININKMIKERIEKIAPVTTLTDKSPAIGSSLIAYDIKKENKKNIMGIDVEL